MHLTNLIAFTAALLPFALTQSIDPSTVDSATKDKWCTDQKSSCPLLCLQIPGATKTPKSNNCDPGSLSYSCVCSNGQQPNASQYSQTIPYYECTEAATQCVNSCSPNDSSCQSACRTDHPCGAQDPVRVNTSTMTTMAATATSSAGGAAFTGKNSDFDGSSTTNGASSQRGPNVQVVALGFGRSCGFAVVLTGFTAAIMWML